MSRCVHCGEQPERHAPETLVCRYGSAAYASMDLPPGATCADCRHLKPTCSKLLGRIGAETTCDWWPVRFVRLPLSSSSQYPVNTPEGPQGGSNA